MSNDSPTSPLAAIIAVGVIAITGLVLWSSSSLLSDSTGSSKDAPSPPLSAIPLPAADESEGESRASGSAASDLAQKEDPLLAKIRAQLKKSHAVPNEALLTFKTKKELTEFIRNAARYGFKVIGTIDGLNTVRIGFEDDRSLAGYLAQAGDNAPAMEPNYWFAVPSLPKKDGSNQGGSVPVGDKLFASINALGDRTHWGDGITVAVLDTGVQAHPTFGDGQVTHVDLVNDGQPFHAHGTSMASLIAGQDERVPGVSPGAHILDIRVANDKGISVSSVLAQGIVEAVDRSAQVINISLGGYDDSQVLREAVAYASSKQVFIVAAAGNEGYTTLAYPAAIPGVISVGAVDARNVQASFSNSGSGLTIAAPGVGLDAAWVIKQQPLMAALDGTSGATSVVTGVIVANYSLGIPYNQMLQNLRTSAKATGAPPDKVGSGVIQVSGKH